MTNTQRALTIETIRARVERFVCGADPSELQPGDTTAAIYAYTYDALRTDGLPDFGTPEWAVLGDDDPRKTHAVTLAALAHLHEQAATATAHRETSDAVRDAMSQHGVTAGPPHAELVRRRIVALEARPARTAEQIAAQTRRSWESVERQIGGDTTSTDCAA